MTLFMIKHFPLGLGMRFPSELDCGSYIASITNTKMVSVKLLSFEVVFYLNKLVPERPRNTAAVS